MIYSLRGKLIHIEQGCAVIECMGVGYKCSTSMTTLTKLPKTGEEAFIYTYMNVREDAVDLYGFADIAELNCFKLLIAITGVGPKAALSILSAMTPEKLALCVATGDVKLLTKAQGIGAKIAQRIVLELKDKVSNADIAAGISANDIPNPAMLTSLNAGEAIDALTALGYNQSEAAMLIAKCPSDMSVEDMIKTALKNIGSK